jgi:hypothetical protein
MANKFIIKKSTVTGKAPVAGDLDVGELAVNTADAKLYTKHSDGAVKELGAAGVIANLDGGHPDTNYGGITALNAGGV